MEAKDLHYSEVFEFAERESSNIDTEENYKEAREALFKELIEKYSSANNCDQETAKRLLGEERQKTDPLEEYQAKKEQKISRYLDLSIRAKRESEQRFKSASELGKMIPMGQPILVGHHSERGHRAHLKKIDNNMRKGIEANGKAVYYAGKIASIESNRAISSDDPEAVVKLKKKLEELLALQEHMKAVNKIVKAKKLSQEEKIKKLAEIGLTDGKIIKLLTPDFMKRIGYPTYALQNNNQNISRIKSRIKQLEALKTEETTGKEINGIRVVDNVEENRLQVFFPDIPSYEVRQKLKGSGFRWSPKNGCWQAYRNNRSSYLIDDIIKEATESN